MRRRLPHARLVLTVLVLLAACLWAFEAWVLSPPSGRSKAAMAASVVGYELAPVPVWPAAFRGFGALSAADEAVIQAQSDRTMEAYATGAALARWLHTDWPAQLLSYRMRNDGRIVVAARGKVVYFDFLGRFPDGRVVLRAAVEHVVTSCRWGAQGEELDVRTGALPTAVIMDYTLSAVDGAWKVSGVRGWRFLDRASGRVTYNPQPAAAP